MALQCSKYIRIENDIEQIAKKFEILDEKVAEVDQFDLDMRFCPTHEVNNTRNQNCVFKATFMVKLKSLKTNGQKLILMRNIYAYLIDNIDTIFEKFQGTKVMLKLQEKLSNR